MSAEKENLDHRSTFPLALGILWLSLALFIILAIAFLLPLLPNDYWWYVRVGQDTMRNQAIPQVDALSYTMAGQPVVYQSWLAAVIFWLTYSVGGTPLTFLLRGLILGITYGWLWYLAREVGAGPKLATILVLISALAGSSNWSIRPQLFAYSLFVICLWVLQRWHRGDSRLLWILPIASLLWVNLHGSFVILFLLAGAAVVFGQGDRKKLALWLGLALLATLINPYGPGAWLYVVNLLSDPVQIYSVEWKPPAFDNWHMQIFFGWVLLFPLIAAASPRRLTRLEWVWFIGFGFMAFSGLRYVIWFLFLLVPITAKLLADWDRKFLDRRLMRTAPAINIGIIALLSISALAVLPGVRDLWWRNQPIQVYQNTPIAATQWLNQHADLPSPLWADLIYSSYLVFALPSRPVWIDTRFIGYTPQHFQDYLTISVAGPDWATLLDRDGVNLLFLSRADQPMLIHLLSQGSIVWCQDYADEQAVIYSRCGK